MSHFPNIEWMASTEFCNKMKFFDKQFGLAAFDRIFVAANVELTS